MGLSWQSGAGTNAGGPTYTARACTGALSRSTDTRSQGFSLRRGHGITGVTVFEDDRGIHTMLFSMSDGKTAVCSALQQQLTWNGPSQSINATAVRGPSSSNSSSSSSGGQEGWPVLVAVQAGCEAEGAMLAVASLMRYRRISLYQAMVAASQWGIDLHLRQQHLLALQHWAAGGGGAA